MKGVNVGTGRKACNLQSRTKKLPLPKNNKPMKVVVKFAQNQTSVTGLPGDVRKDITTFLEEKGYEVKDVTFTIDVNYQKGETVVTGDKVVKRLKEPLQDLGLSVFDAKRDRFSLEGDCRRTLQEWLPDYNVVDKTPQEEDGEEDGEKDGCEVMEGFYTRLLKSPVFDSSKWGVIASTLKVLHYVPPLTRPQEEAEEPSKAILDYPEKKLVIIPSPETNIVPYLMSYLLGKKCGSTWRTSHLEITIPDKLFLRDINDIYTLLSSTDYLGIVGDRKTHYKVNGFTSMKKKKPKKPLTKMKGSTRQSKEHRDDHL